MWTAFGDRLFGWPDITLLFGLNLLLQSTLIILIGLAGLSVLKARRKGATAQSLLLRICLAGVLFAPPVLLISSALGVKGLHVSVPMRKVPDAAVSPESVFRHAPSAPVSGAGKAEILPGKTAPVPEKASAAVSQTSSPSTALPPRKPNQSSAMNGSIPPGTTIAAPGSPTPHPLAQGIPRALSIPFALTWASLTLFLALRTVAIALYIRRIRRLSSPALPRYADRCREAARELGIPSPPVLQSPYVTSTLLTGFLRPAILFPAGGDEAAMATREIFLHELAHLARRDPLWLHLCQIAKILLPFQPLLWVLARRIEELSDYACDDYVIRHTGNSRPYAAQLFDLARSFHPGGIETAAGSGIFSPRFPLLRRIEHILDNSYSRHITVSANEAMSFTIIFLCAVTLSGFTGFRWEREAGNAYAAESHTPRGGKNFLKTLSRLHVPLGAPIAALTMEKQRADAAPSREISESSPERETSAPEPDPRVPPDETPVTTALAPRTASIDQSVPNGPTASTEEAEYAARPLSTEAAVPVTAQTAPEPETAENPGSLPEKAKGPHAKTADGSSLPSGLPELSTAAAGYGDTAVPQPGMVKVDAPDAAGKVLRESLELGQENPVWSPSGNDIAFTGNGGRGIWKVRVNGGKPELLYDNTRNLSSGATGTGGLSRTLCFSPDGRELTFVNYAPESGTDGTAKAAGSEALSSEPSIESINLETGERHSIAEGASDGCWSRDGRYFIYSESDSRGIGILDVVTGKRRLITETGLSPCLTPDGVSIIYVDQSRTGMNDLYRVPLAGGTPEQLTSGGIWKVPKISPDGVWVLSTGYGIPQYGQDTLFWAFNLRNRMSYFFTINGAETVEMGTWSPSGRQYCYTRYRATMKNGAVVNRPAIYIDDFQPSNFSRTTAESTQPHEFKLVGNYPNPFNPSTTIQFSLATAGPAELAVYNMLGQKIRSLVSGRMEAGMHSVVWNGRDQENKPVSSGIYVARLKMEGKVETRRMTLVK